MNLLYYGFAVLVFIAVALSVEALWQWWFSTQSKAAKRLTNRLEEVRRSSMTSAADRQRASELYRHRRLAESQRAMVLLQKVPGIHSFDDYLRQSGMDRSVAMHLLYTLAAAGAGLVVGSLLFLSIWSGLLSMLIGSALPTVMVAARRSERLRKLEMQLPEAADLISRSLRAGHALPATLQMVAEEMPDPIGGEFRIVSDEINFGAPLADALQRLASRVPLTDLRYMIVAILIQREAGGNLSEIMGNVSRLVRQRLKLLGDVRSLSAEGRLSAWILCLLPVALAAVFMVTQPDYLNGFFDDPAGPKMLMVSVGMMAVGVVWMRHIIRIRV